MFRIPRDVEIPSNHHIKTMWQKYTGQKKNSRLRIFRRKFVSTNCKINITFATSEKKKNTAFIVNDDKCGYRCAGHTHQMSEKIRRTSVENSYNTE